MNTKTKISTAAIIFIGAIGYGYYYYFVQTLRLSDIISSTNNPFTSVFISFIDFDTGLTRYDLHDLSEKTPYWNQRINEIEGLPPGREKQFRQQQLVTEMLKDPAMRKIINRLMPFGFKTIEYFLKALSP